MYRIYGFDECPFCQKAKTLLADNNFSFEYVNVGSDRKAKSDFLDSRGFVPPSRTFPRVYKVGEDGAETLIGGFNDLEMYVLTL